MIRTPLEGLRAAPARALAACVVLAWAIAGPGAVALSAQRASAHLEAWLIAARPIVYFEADASAAMIEASRRRWQAWPEIARAERRDGEEALQQLSAEVGAETVADLGLTPALMPASVVLIPEVDLHGHIELAAKAEALIVRDEVSSVAVPPASALGWMRAARSALLFAMMLFAALLACASALVVFVLRSLQLEERCELALLEIYGVGGVALARPTIARGAVIGAGSGVIATLSLGLIHAHVDAWGAALGAQAPTHPWAWALISAPLIITPLLGALLGAVAARRPRPRSKARAQTRPLLQFDPRAVLG